MEWKHTCAFNQGWARCCSAAPLSRNLQLCSDVGHIWGGVRLRSRLSPGGGQNQKCNFKAKTDAFFINSFIYRAYYVKSYKKMIKRLNILISLHLQWDWDRNREILPEICISVQNAIFLWFSYQKTNSAWTRWKRRSRCFRIFMTHRGEKLFFHWYRLSKLGNIYFKSFQIWAYFVNFSSSPSRSTRTPWNK